MITFVKGDATKPKVEEGSRYILHICNDLGKWGSGFVVAISKKWKSPEKAYRDWAAGNKNEYVVGDETFELGSIQLVPAEEDIVICNMVAQHGIRTRNNAGDPAPIQYLAVRLCLRKFAHEVSPVGCTVHMPRIGCGRAGGEWSEIEPIIQQELVDKGFDVYVYDYEEKGKLFSLNK